MIIKEKQLRKIILKETELLEQTMEIEKLISDNVIDAIFNGINNAIHTFSGNDNIKFEDFVSEYVYYKMQILDKIVDDKRFLDVIEKYAQDFTEKNIENEKQKIEQRFLEEVDDNEEEYEEKID